MVAALEQAIVVNRFGAFIPADTLYALKGDIVRRDGRAIDWDRPAKSAGQVKLRSDKLVVLRGGKAPDHSDTTAPSALARATRRARAAASRTASSPSSCTTKSKRCRPSPSRSLLWSYRSNQQSLFETIGEIQVEPDQQA